MSNSTAASSAPKKGRRWLRWLAGTVAILMVLLVAGYLIATSSAFFKGVILPRVGAALNSSVTVSDAAIHPFSGIDLRDLKVQPNGQPPLVTASEVRVSYHLLDILGGNLRVDEIALVSPTVELVQNPDGSSNLGSDSEGAAVKTDGRTETSAGRRSRPSRCKLTWANWPWTTRPSCKSRITRMAGAILPG